MGSRNIFLTVSIEIVFQKHTQRQSKVKWVDNWNVKVSFVLTVSTQIIVCYLVYFSKISPLFKLHQLKPQDVWKLFISITFNCWRLSSISHVWAANRLPQTLGK